MTNSRYHSFVVSIMRSGNLLIMIIFILALSTYKLPWYLFYIVGAFMSTLAFLLAFFIPESVGYLHDKGRYQESRTSLRIIALTNKIKNWYLTKPFEEEILQTKDQ